MLQAQVGVQYSIRLAWSIPPLSLYQITDTRLEMSQGQVGVQYSICHASSILPLSLYQVTVHDLRCYTLRPT